MKHSGGHNNAALRHPKIGAAERAEATALLEVQHAEIRAVVATGKCPLCGAGLRRNLSITGWWQCEQLGAVTHRKNPALPPCSWQGFTE